MLLPINVSNVAAKRLFFMIALPHLPNDIGSPAILGSFVASDGRGGSEDPWLCVTSFGWFCLCRKMDFAPLEIGVNSGMYLN
jgi:hypothetical protein